MPIIILKLPDIPTIDIGVAGNYVFMINPADNTWLLSLDSRVQILEELPAMTTIRILDENGNVLDTYTTQNVDLVLKDGAVEPPPVVGINATVLATSVRVRSSYSTSAAQVGTVYRNQNFLVDGTEENGGYRWYKIVSGEFAGNWVAGVVLSSGVVWIQLDPAVPIPPPTGTAKGPITVEAGRFVINGTRQKVLGGAMHLHWLYPKYNPAIMSATKFTDAQYYGDPAFPDDGTLGKARATGFKVMNYYACNKNASVVPDPSKPNDRVSNFTEMVDANKKWLSQLHLFGLYGFPKLMDSIGTDATLAEYAHMHTGPGGHLSVDFWLNKSWRGVYMTWLKTLVTALKDHPAFGGVLLMNEPQIPDSARVNTAIYENFKLFCQESIAAIKAIVDVPVGLGNINFNHIWNGGYDEAKRFFTECPFDIVTANHYQDIGAGANEYWEQETLSEIDAGVAKERELVYLATECGQRIWGADPYNSMVNYLDRQLMPDHNDGDGAFVWGWYYEGDDRWLGDNEFGMTFHPKQPNGIYADNPAFKSIVEFLFNSINQKRWG